MQREKDMNKFVAGVFVFALAFGLTFSQAAVAAPKKVLVVGVGDGHHAHKHHARKHHPRRHHVDKVHGTLVLRGVDRPHHGGARVQVRVAAGGHH